MKRMAGFHDSVQQPQQLHHHSISASAEFSVAENTHETHSMKQISHDKGARDLVPRLHQVVF